MAKGGTSSVRFESLEGRMFLSASSTVLDKAAIAALSGNGPSANADQGLNNAFERGSQNAIDNSPVFQAMLPAPSVTGVSISYDSATSATSLTANATTNANGNPNPITLGYQWLKNGSPISGATAATLDLTTVSGLAANDNLTVQVTPTAGVVTGATFTSQVVSIANVGPTTLKLPTVTAVDITPDNVGDVQTLTATPTATNPYGRTNTFTYQWLQNGALIAGETSQTLNLAGLTVAVGDTFEVLVTPSDGTLTGVQFSDGEVVTVATASPAPITLA
jgi:hypothetical protein